MIRLPHPVYMAADAGTDTADTTKVAADATVVAADATADKGTGTALDLPDESTDKKIVAPTDFPDDWRAKMAGDDKAALKRLERFKTPADLAKSYLEADKKLTSGKAGTVDPAPDGSKDPEALKTWREANGIPADPTGYELPKPVQERLTDADKPILASYTEAMHKANIPPKAVEAGASWYVEMQEQAFAAQSAADAKAAEEVQDELRKDYGQEFRGNVTMAKRFAEEITPGVNWFEARLQDGRKLGNIPDFVKALVDLGAQKYGDVAFAGGEASAKTATELEQIQHVMDTDFAKYDGDPSMKKRYFELNQALEKRRK